MLKKLILFLSFSLCYSSSYDALIEELAKPYDLVDTIKVIVSLESKNGIYPVNLQDPACGITHININTYMKRHNIKNTNFNRNKACADLILIPGWAITNAIEELEFWKKIHCKQNKCSARQYQNVIRSYNAGWKYRSAKADEYWLKFKTEYKRIIK